MVDQPPNTAATGDPLLRAFLAERDASCPSCNYSLRGLMSDRCPECNQALALRVNLVETRLGWWATGLVGLAAGAGFSGLLIVYFLLVFYWIGGRRPALDLFLLATVPSCIIELSLAVLWCRFGRSIRRRTNSSIAILAIGCWLVTLANLAAFAIILR